jgi:hypothetical protein
MMKNFTSKNPSKGKNLKEKRKKLNAKIIILQ